MRRILKWFNIVVGTIFWIVMLSLLIVPLAFSAIYLDRNGVTISGVVVAKNERITPISRTLSWTRNFRIEVRYEPADQPWEHIATLPVDAATYDQARVGDVVQLRYAPVPWIRTFLYGVRLEGQTTLSLLGMIGYGAFLPVILLIIALALGWRLRRARTRFGRVALGSLTALFVVALILVVSRPDQLIEPSGPRLTATATVRDVRRVTTKPSRRRSNELWKPFDRVELAFTPQGGDAVVVVDDIDVGSAPGLREGATIEVAYPPDDPRRARIVGATHSYRVINWLGDLGLFVGLLAILGVSWLFSRFRRAAKRRRVMGSLP